MVNYTAYEVIALGILRFIWNLPATELTTTVTPHPQVARTLKGAATYTKPTLRAPSAAQGLKIM